MTLQAKAWDPVLTWAQVHLAATFKATVGVVHVDQPAAALKTVEQHVAKLNSYALTGVHNVMTLTGSALLALMFHSQAITGEACWAAAHVDEDFQISQWGEDFEAVARRAHRKMEFEATLRFLELCV